MKSTMTLKPSQTETAAQEILDILNREQRREAIRELMGHLDKALKAYNESRVAHHHIQLRETLGHTVKIEESDKAYDALAYRTGKLLQVLRRVRHAELYFSDEAQDGDTAIEDIRNTYNKLIVGMSEM